MHGRRMSMVAILCSGIALGGCEQPQEDEPVDIGYERASSAPVPMTDGATPVPDNSVGSGDAPTTPDEQGAGELPDG